jgi:hypothetical protein
MRGLTTLVIGSDQVTDFGFSYIGHLRELEFLEVRLPKVTDFGLFRLRQLGKLKRLDLVGDRDAVAENRPQFSWMGFRYIAATPLETLWITSIKLDRDCIDRLAKMTKLKELVLNWTMVSPEDEKRLKEALPKVRVMVSPSRMPGGM